MSDTVTTFWAHCDGCRALLDYAITLSEEQQRKYPIYGICCGGRIPWKEER